MVGNRLTSKFQTTVPKEIREYLGLSAGDRVVFLRKGNEVIVKGIKTTLLDMQGAVKSPKGGRKSSEELRRAAKKHVAARHPRSRG